MPFRARPTTELPAARLTCRAAVELLSDHIDGALPAAQSARVRAHLETCPECRVHLGQLRATIALLGRLREPGLRLSSSGHERRAG